MEEKSSKFASKGYVYRKLKELPFTAGMNRRKFSSLLEETLQSINSSKAFIQGRKLSQLFPQQVSIVQKFINTIDAQAFWRLVKQSEIPNYPKQTKSESDLTDFYHQLFNFPKLGFRTRESLTTVKKTFKLCISDIQNGCTVWGVDPGIIDLITAVDSSGDKERQRATSLDEYYHLCGYNQTTFQRHKHQSQNESVFQLISQLPSLKTTNSHDFLLASKKRLKQKAVEEICKRLVVESKKYGRGSKTGVKTATENTSIHYPNAPQDAENPPTSTVTAFGDATFYGKQSRACEDRALENVSTAKSKRRVHSVLKCNNNSCNIVWNRDINAAKNIFDIFMFAAHNNNRRPPAFERPEQTI
ncbi:uncharacterized protein EV154DRAFT_585849 [Mucor mucedo]|uniref:uncharacterized protein n=1 Tax=Mucor mucedo TaxID=29922 RepID=UPI00221FE17B|nr:uncharacterized protein EV154DRAFT_585849 [Mucor mucedo]KAI7892632.1 hypothetical protein EV154DRAFT_585849 [Mucor mucedo]